MLLSRAAGAGAPPGPSLPPLGQPGVQLSSPEPSLKNKTRGHRLWPPPPPSTQAQTRLQIFLKASRMGTTEQVRAGVESPTHPKTTTAPLKLQAFASEVARLGPSLLRAEGVLTFLPLPWPPGVQACAVAGRVTRPPGCFPEGCLGRATLHREGPDTAPGSGLCRPSREQAPRP